jgi:hypothetical protein
MKVHGGIPKLVVIPGRDAVANFDVQLHIGEVRAAGLSSIMSTFQVRRYRVAPE